MDEPVTIGAMCVIGFPGRYVQGPGALSLLGTLTAELGARRPVLVSDDVVERQLGDRVPQALAAAGLPHCRLRFGGECTRAAVADLAAQARAAGADAVIALGGGKTIDTAKGVARELGAALLVAPTVASNDAPTSRLIVLYDEAHRLVGVDMLARNPDVVLVDTAVIVRAPLRFFRAGIGDAISKRFEAAQCAGSGGRNFFGGRPPDIAGVMADRCHAVIVRHGAQALAAVAAQQCDAAVEAVTEATVLLSGLGFESGGLSLSHALLRGLTAVPSLAGALHGEMVAFGTMVQLQLEQRPEAEQAAHAALLLGLGLPVTLEGLGQAELPAGLLDEVARLTMQAPYIGHFERPLTAPAIAQAVLAADARGRALQAQRPAG
ncbi:glycerol dehydrogenase [Aquincola sp. MAHUQ-54]|uniref:Glycerol dehydrogenase n=1 Tax=Aquincola agrisoli TaxID=3119538 RepID=A0AAW9QNP7_9BURK